MKVLNSTVYIFVCEPPHVVHAVLQEAEVTHQHGALNHVCINDESSMQQEIRNIKAAMQRSATCELNMQRVNIYVVARAYNPLVPPLIAGLCTNLRSHFLEDFATCDITLAALLCDSNAAIVDGITYEERGHNTYAFLLATASDIGCNRIFLLSNRNQHGRVVPHEEKNTYALLATLPLTHTVHTGFDSAIGAKARETGRIIFASAGLGQPLNSTSPLNGATTQALHKLAKILETEIAAPKGAPVSNTPLYKLPNYNNLTEIEANITSVAAMPLSSLDLRGATIKEAEAVLFGKSAQGFYHAQYAGRQEAVQTGGTQVLLSQAAAEEYELARMLADISASVQSLELEIAKKENAQVPLGLLRVVDKVKDQIGQCYTLRYKLEGLQKAQQALQTRYEDVANYIAYMRDVIAALFALPLPQEKNQQSLLLEARENTHVNICLRRDDGLVREEYNFGDAASTRVLQLVGGFVAEDMMRFYALKQLFKV